MKEKFESILATCDIHVKRLRWAMGKIKPFIPINAETFSRLSEEQVAIFDQFSTRFSKLQNYMAIKLFSLVLEISEESMDSAPFIDKLNKLEKLRVIPSTEQWLEFRNTRNQFTHDYPENSDQNSKTFNKAFQEAEELLNIFEHVKKYITNLVLLHHSRPPDNE
jgi:hypothetical protein